MKHIIRHFSFATFLLLIAASFLGCSAQQENLTNIIQIENSKAATTPLSTPGNSPLNTVLPKEIDLRINGVGLGTSESTILQKFGKPLRNKKGEFNSCGDDYEKTISYSGLVIELLGNEKERSFSVFSVEVTSSKWSDASGIKIGADAKDVLAKFGEPLEKTNKSGIESWSYVNKGNDGSAGFYFRDNKLVKVLWQSVIC